MTDLRLIHIARHYGMESQLNILQEECAELIQAVSKYRRMGMSLEQIPSNILEEIADVEIMLAQARLFLGNLVCKEIDNIKEDKIKRQINRIREEEE